MLDHSTALPHDQEYYDAFGARQGSNLIAEGGELIRRAVDSASRHEVIVGTGEVLGTGGGTQALSVMRFLHPTVRIRAGETVEWINQDPVEPHTVTFGTEPPNILLPTPNVSVDPDGALRATIGSTGNNVSSGLVGAAPEDRLGLENTPLGTTHVRITFINPGTYPYICGLHDELGMKGKVVVSP